MKSKTHHFLNHSFWGSVIITLLIFASVFIFSLETEYPKLKVLQSLNLCVALIFMVEYFARIWIADKDSEHPFKSRISYIFSFYGLVDLIAFLPILIFPAIDGSTVLRLLRIVRLVQLMKIRAVTRSLKRIGGALKRSQD